MGGLRTQFWSPALHCDDNRAEEGTRRRSAVTLCLSPADLGTEMASTAPASIQLPLPLSLILRTACKQQPPHGACATCRGDVNANTAVSRELGHRPRQQARAFCPFSEGHVGSPAVLKSWGLQCCRVHTTVTSVNWPFKHVRQRTAAGPLLTLGVCVVAVESGGQGISSH